MAKKDQIKERHVEVDKLNPMDLASIDKYEDSYLNSLLNSSKEQINDPIILRQQFLKDLEAHSKAGKDLYTYRALKTGLIEMRNSASELAPRVNMTVKEFIGHIEKTIKTLDNHVLDARDEMYNEALKLLADEQGFKELEQARLAYQKALEVHYLMGTIQDQKQLANSKVNLLDVLRKDNDGTTNR